MSVKSAPNGRPRMQRMNAYPNVIVALDGSEPAARGLDEAIRLVKTHGGNLRILHIVDEGAAPRTQADGRRIVDAAASAARKAGIAAEVDLVQAIGGATASFMLRAAKDGDASLIVLGTHGRRGLRRWVMGSDAEEVVRRSPVPVLLVPGGEPA
jgi:nucleotide-binding universal stress UspA family protein